MTKYQPHRAASLPAKAKMPKAGSRGPANKPRLLPLHLPRRRDRVAYLAAIEVLG